MDEAFYPQELNETKECLHSYEYKMCLLTTYSKCCHIYSQSHIQEEQNAADSAEIWQVEHIQLACTRKTKLSDAIKNVAAIMTAICSLLACAPRD